MFITKLFDLLSPRTCAGCGARLSPHEQTFCASCHLHLQLTDYHRHPFDNPMARLFWGRLPIERAAAYCLYEANTRLAHAIHAMKYHNRPDLAEDMGVLMARSWADSAFFDGIDGIVPVPLTRQRQQERGYNQSACMAKGISQITGLPIYKKVIERTDFLQSQTRLNAYERQANVSRAFRLADAGPLSGHHLLLVDDVITTGATLQACATSLLGIPDIRISIATFAITAS